MPDAPPATVEDMFVQTAGAVRTDGKTMTLLGLTPHTIYFSDRPEEDAPGTSAAVAPATVIRRRP